MKKLATKLVLAATVAGALGAGTFAFASSQPAKSAACVPDPNAICPAIYDPVICNDGQVYGNRCYAQAACARGCRSTNEL